MKFTLSLARLEPLLTVPLAIEAEALGFECVSMPDSVFYPDVSDSEYPYTVDRDRSFLAEQPFFEPMLALSAVAAVTRRVRMQTSVMKLPIRHPVHVAKQVASLAVLSNNRFRLGVGTSPWPDDYAVCDVPWEHRGKRFLECIEIVQGLTAGGFFEYHGRFYDFPQIKINPTPSKPVPLILGGHSDLQLRRTARIAEGWVAAATKDFDELAGIVSRLHGFLVEAGREPRGFEVATQTPARTRAEAEQLAEIGVTNAVVRLSPFKAGRSVEEARTIALDELRAYADAVVRPLNDPAVTA